VDAREEKWREDVGGKKNGGKMEAGSGGKLSASGRKKISRPVFQGGEGISSSRHRGNARNPSPLHPHGLPPWISPDGSTPMG
jgi:hypothetical protein